MTRSEFLSVASIVNTDWFPYSLISIPRPLFVTWFTPSPLIVQLITALLPVATQVKLITEPNVALTYDGGAISPITFNMIKIYEILAQPLTIYGR